MTVEEEITGAIDEFVNAYNSGDINAVLACYGDDLVKLRQGAPIVAAFAKARAQQTGPERRGRV